MNRLLNKTTVTTGGSSGIGLATAKRFVEEGADVFIVGRRRAGLDRATSLINRNVTAVQADVTGLEDLDRLYAKVRDERGHIDVLFANSGTIEHKTLEQITREHYEKTFDVNVRGLIFTVQKALPLLRDGSSVILTSSVAGVMGINAHDTYKQFDIEQVDPDPQAPQSMHKLYDFHRPIVQNGLAICQAVSCPNPVQIWAWTEGKLNRGIRIGLLQHQLVRNSGIGLSH